MPAEWEPLDAIWLAWPHLPEIWPADFDDVERSFGELIARISKTARVELLVENDAVERSARRRIERAGAGTSAVRFHRVPTDDTWIRDSGPTFLVRRAADGGKELAGVCWKFNAWGGKFPHDRDALVARRICDRTGARAFAADFVFEGGSIDVDGEGLALTTEQCLLHPNRNPGLLRGEIESIVLEHVGGRRLVWLGQGLEGDDTDGHVDDVARFLGPGLVVLSWTEDRDDPNFPALSMNKERLLKASDPNGSPLRVETLPLPAPLWDGDRRLPASYVNFLWVNGRLLVPTFGCPQDEKALSKLASLASNAEVVGIDCRALLAGGGAIHCLTQQQPRIA